MKDNYLSPEWKLIYLQTSDIITSSYEGVDPEDPWTKDY